MKLRQGEIQHKWCIAINNWSVFFGRKGTFGYARLLRLTRLNDKFREGESSWKRCHHHPLISNMASTSTAEPVGI